MSAHEFPKRTHFDCEVDSCRVCLDDHMALAKYIGVVSGGSPRFHDFLGEYRTWLDRQGIPAESEDGWTTREAWSQDNVHAFIEENWEVVVEPA